MYRCMFGKRKSWESIDDILLSTRIMFNFTMFNQLHTRRSVGQHQSIVKLKHQVV